MEEIITSAEIKEGKINEYTLSLKRIQINDLMMACTGIIIAAKNEKRCPETSDARKEILDDTIKKWKRLHDELKRQLNEQDAE